MFKYKWQYLPFAVFLLLTLFLYKGLSLHPHELPSVQINKQLPVFNIPSLEEPAIPFSNAELNNQVSLINIWASWCTACAEEQPFLMDLARKKILIYGINYKDSATNAKQWLSEWGNPYKKVGVDSQGKVAMDLGVYGTPETFVVDKHGIIRYRHTGPLDLNVWQQKIKPLIVELEKQ